MKRRVFLISAALVAAVASAAGLLRWLGLSASPEPASEDSESPASTAVEQQAAAAEPAAEKPWQRPIFPTEDHALLLMLADLIVPREGEHPAASEIDLIPRLERWIHSSGTRKRSYRKGWPKLRRVVKRVGFVDGELDTVRLTKRMRAWSRRFRKRRRMRGRVIPFFEQLRRDVLRVYYSSPAGWAAMGYTGPARVSHPAPRANPADESHT